MTNTKTDTQPDAIAAALDELDVFAEAPSSRAKLDAARAQLAAVYKAGDCLATAVENAADVPPYIRHRVEEYRAARRA